MFYSEKIRDNDLKSELTQQMEIGSFPLLIHYTVLIEHLLENHYPTLSFQIL